MRSSFVWGRNFPTTRRRAKAIRLRPNLQPFEHWVGQAGVVPLLEIRRSSPKRSTQPMPFVHGGWASVPRRQRRPNTAPPPGALRRGGVQLAEWKTGNEGMNGDVRAKGNEKSVARKRPYQVVSATFFPPMRHLFTPPASLLYLSAPPIPRGRYENDPRRFFFGQAFMAVPTGAKNWKRMRGNFKSPPRQDCVSSATILDQITATAPTWQPTIVAYRKARTVVGRVLPGCRINCPVSAPVGGPSEPPQLVFLRHPLPQGRCPDPKLSGTLPPFFRPKERLRTLSLPSVPARPSFRQPSDREDPIVEAGKPWPQLNADFGKLPRLRRAPLAAENARPGEEA